MTFTLPSFLRIASSPDTPVDSRDISRAGVEALLLMLAIIASRALVVAVVRSRADPETVRLVTHAMLPGALIVLGAVWVLFRVRLRGLTDARRIGVMAASAESTARELRHEQQRLRGLIEGTNVGTWEANLAADHVTMDERCATMLGYEPQALRQLSLEAWNALVHREDIEVMTDAVQMTFLDPQHVFDVDLRMKAADGRWVWVASRGHVSACDDRGKPVQLVGVHMDITARKTAELALKQSEARFRTLFELSPVGICMNEAGTGRYLYANDAMIRPTGYTREELLRMSYFDFSVPGFEASDAEYTRRLQEEGQAEGYEVEHRRKGGGSYPVLLSGMLANDGERQVIWSVVQDISSRKAMETELAAAARRDRLTGLANRSTFMERLERSMERVRSGSLERFAVLFLDFDRFKLVNDAMGHEAGDLLLKQIAERLRRSLRASDTNDARDNLVARFGGDEFLVLLNDLCDPRDAVAVAERLLNALSPSYTIHGREVSSTASIGIVTSDQCLESADAVVRNADVAMYEAKRAGRGCSVVFSEAMHTRLTRHLAIEGSLRKALGTPELTLVYQPIIDLNSRRMVSAEALLRWHHPVLGHVSPAEFIPVAEESGLIISIGQWVLREACATLVRWRATDPAAAPRTISVNVSRAELALGRRLLDQVRDTLEATGLPANCLQLEVTEREVMRDPAASQQVMQELRGLGVRLAMDDFGTGTSSLGCLRDYPFDVIKIDRSFVGDVATNPDMLALIHATITLVENLGKTSVAEGVEDGAQVAVLQSLGCRQAQGYHFSRPVPAHELLATVPRDQQAVPATALLLQ
jgi:diguanylate cyclase (GGDEF)-like protein/PAS domain S-box-containing protein